MSLSKDDLKKGIANSFIETMAKSFSRLLSADGIVTAYDAYAKDARDVTDSKPTLTNVTALKNMLRVTNAKNPLFPGEPALGWANAFGAYWSLAMFGSSLVDPITMKVAQLVLTSRLQLLWSLKGMPATLELATGGLADHLHEFTTSLKAGGSFIT